MTAGQHRPSIGEVGLFRGSPEDRLNGVMAAGGLWVALNHGKTSGFRARPVVDADGQAQPMLDVSIDYGAGWTPWHRLTITLSPDQHEDAFTSTLEGRDVIDSGTDVADA